jgi:hypothetical protein
MLVAKRLKIAQKYVREKRTWPFKVIEPLLNDLRSCEPMIATVLYGSVPTASISRETRYGV